MHVYLLRHLQVALTSLGQLSRTPLSTLMTAAVLGIALAMPLGLHLLLFNVHQATRGWDGAAQISLFLKQHVNDDQAQTLTEQVRQAPGVASARTISRAQAMEEFRRHSGFGDALDILGENPFPAVIVVYPEIGASHPAAIEGMLQQLRQRPEIDIAQLDMQWVKRLYALTDIGRRGIWVLSALLGLSVLLIVGNTIRLSIFNRRDEIEVIKLIGGTDAFIRRPFLYSGIWFGLLGGSIAWSLVAGSLWLLSGPVARLSSLYGSGFELSSLDLATSLSVLLGGPLLGLLGSWLAVGRHLGAIEPV